jgi:hypothetical protein
VGVLVDFDGAALLLLTLPLPSFSLGGGDDLLALAVLSLILLAVGGDLPALTLLSLTFGCGGDLLALVLPSLILLGGDGDLLVPPFFSFVLLAVDSSLLAPLFPSFALDATPGVENGEVLALFEISAATACSIIGFFEAALAPRASCTILCTTVNISFKVSDGFKKGMCSKYYQ